MHYHWIHNHAAVMEKRSSTLVSELLFDRPLVKCKRLILLTNINACSGCNLGLKCCNSYEYCVSCCLSPAKVFVKTISNFNWIAWLLNILNGTNWYYKIYLQTQEDTALKVKIAKPITAGNSYVQIGSIHLGYLHFNESSVQKEILCYLYIMILMGNRIEKLLCLLLISLYIFIVEGIKEIYICVYMLGSLFIIFVAYIIRPFLLGLSPLC